MSDLPHSKERRLQGMPVAPGIASGPVFVHWRDTEEIPVRTISHQDIPDEVTRFESALIATRAELLEIQQRIANSLGAKDASIFDAHLLVVEDRTLIDEVLRKLQHDHHNVEFVFHEVAEQYRRSLSEIDDDYLRERALDLEDVTRRILRHLMGKTGHVQFEHNRPHIVVAMSLTPSDTALIDRSLVQGFATEEGSKTSHSAIMARSMNLPAIVGIRGICDEVATGDFVLIDGYKGILIVHPSEDTLREYGNLKTQREEIEEKLGKIRETTSTTRDGRHIVLSANMDLSDEVNEVLTSGAEGIGLYRTEFLYLNRETPPSEEEQFENYRTVAEKVLPHGTIIRTLDIGGDKLISSLNSQIETNPFLGRRAIRFCLDHPHIFKTQLRAILRASAFGNVRLMYPLISGLEELHRANAILKTCKDELRSEGVAFNENLNVGIMIEVPSAALCADVLAREVNFFSIGTNDLIQYTLAVDRVNEYIAHLYDPTHPAVIQLIQMVVEAGRATKIEVGICGEMAGDLYLTPLLLGLGLEKLSVGTAQVPRVKKAIQSLDMSLCQKMVNDALIQRNSAHLLSQCKKMARQHYAEILD